MGGEEPSTNCFSDTRYLCHDVFTCDPKSIDLAVKHLYYDSLLEATLPDTLTQFSQQPVCKLPIFRKLKRKGWSLKTLCMSDLCYSLFGLVFWSLERCTISMH